MPRRVELWSNNSKKSVVLLTNNFELDVRDAELPTAFLLRRQCLRHTDTNMGGINCEPSMYHCTEDDKTAYVFFASSNDDTANTYVLHQLCLLYRKSR